MLFCVTFGCMVWLLGESGIVVFWSASCISVHRPPKQPRKSIQYYFAIYPRINGRVPKDAWRSILAPLFLGFHCESSSSDTEKNAKERTLIGPPPSIIEGDVKNRSSTSCAIGVVLHRREKIYFIGKVSSTAPKGTKTVFSFRHPKSPQKQQKCLGNLKNVSRAQYIYNERKEKFRFIHKKVVPMLVKRPEPMYLCNRKQGGTLLKRVPLGFAPRKGRVL